MHCFVPAAALLPALQMHSFTSLGSPAMRENWRLSFRSHHHCKPTFYIILPLMHLPILQKENRAPKADRVKTHSTFNHALQ